MLGVKRFADLDIHKLAVQLQRDVFRLTAQRAVSRDYKFAAQIRDAARGGPRNIAEGFSRGAPFEFREFLSYAKASIAETKNHVEDARENRCFGNDDCDQMLRLAHRSIAASTH